MKKLFLASSVNTVAAPLIKDVDSQKNPNLIFITTASEPEKGDKSWLKKDRQSLVDGGFHVEDFTLTSKTHDEVKEKVSLADVIFVSGGNTFYLLKKAQQCGFIPLVNDLIEKGKPYIGSSAGSVFAGPDIEPVEDLDNKAVVPNLVEFSGANLVDFVVLPHWGSEIFKNNYLKGRIQNNYNTKNKIILLTDNQYIVVNDDWYKIVDITRSL